MSSKPFFSLVFGLAAGTALGLLLAPEKGEATREKVRKAAEDGLDKLESFLKKHENE